MIRNFNKQLYVKKLKNLEQIDKFLANKREKTQIVKARDQTGEIKINSNGRD